MHHRWQRVLSIAKKNVKDGNSPFNKHLKCCYKFLHGYISTIFHSCFMATMYFDGALRPSIRYSPGAGISQAFEFADGFLLHSAIVAFIRDGRL